MIWWFCVLENESLGGSSAEVAKQVLTNRNGISASFTVQFWARSIGRWSTLVKELTSEDFETSNGERIGTKQFGWF